MFLVCLYLFLFFQSCLSWFRQWKKGLSWKPFLTGVPICHEHVFHAELSCLCALVLVHMITRKIIELKLYLVSITYRWLFTSLHTLETIHIVDVHFTTHIRNQPPPPPQLLSLMFLVCLYLFLFFQSFLSWFRQWNFVQISCFFSTLFHKLYIHLVTELKAFSNWVTHMSRACFNFMLSFHVCVRSCWSIC